MVISADSNRFRFGTWVFVVERCEWNPNSKNWIATSKLEPLNMNFLDFQNFSLVIAKALKSNGSTWNIRKFEA